MGPSNRLWSFRINLLQPSVLQGAWSGCAPVWSFMGCWGTTCFSEVFSTGCRGISFLVTPDHPLPLSDLNVHVAVSHFFSFLFLTTAVHHFLLFLKSVATDAPSAPLIGLSLDSSLSTLETAGTVSLWQGYSFWSLLTEFTSAVLATTKTWPCKINTHPNLGYGDSTKYSLPLGY